MSEARHATMTMGEDIGGGTMGLFNDSAAVLDESIYYDSYWQN